MLLPETGPRGGAVAAGTAAAVAAGVVAVATQGALATLARWNPLPKTLMWPIINSLQFPMAQQVTLKLDTRYRSVSKGPPDNRVPDYDCIDCSVMRHKLVMPTTQKAVSCRRDCVLPTPSVLDTSAGSPVGVKSSIMLPITVSGASLMAWGACA
eukprot:6173609-Pleurochrysis_carterae.AAC.3